jgi:opacity protein-like surface antigen
MQSDLSGNYRKGNLKIAECENQIPGLTRMVKAEKPKSRHNFLNICFMRSCRLITVALFSFFYVCSSAQNFVGGDFGVSATGGSVKNQNLTTDKSSSLTLGLSPKIGKFINEKVAAGLGLSLSLNQTKTPGNVNVITTSTGLGLNPFVRYYAARFNKFSVFGEGTLDLSFSTSKTKVGNTTSNGPKTNEIGLGIAPGLSYDLSNKLSLETALHFMGFGYTYSSEVSGNSTDRSSTFNLGAGLNHIATLGSVSIGAIYKF